VIVWILILVMMLITYGEKILVVVVIIVVVVVVDVCLGQHVQAAEYHESREGMDCTSCGLE